jgi:hypothetical protein
MKYFNYPIIRFSVMLLFVVFFPAPLFAATAPAGVPKDALWFSKDPFFVGETITVFTVVYNSTSYRLSGTMELRDGTTTISKKDFIVDTLGASQIVSFPLTVTAGNHLFTVAITQNELRKEGGTLSTDLLAETKTTGAKRYADLDTDTDGIGNIIDTDDDGDGLTDAEEKKLKTDPLDPDTDGDLLPDGKDPHPLIKDKTDIATTSLPSFSIPKSDPVSFVEEKIKTTLPEPIVSKAVPILGSIEDFRTRQAGDADERVSGLIATIKGTTSTPLLETHTGARWLTLGQGVTHGDVAKSPFAYAKLFFVLVWHFVTSSVYVFYVLILLIIFKLIRFLFRLFF